MRKDQQAKPLVYLPSSEEIHLQVGSSSKKLWSIWLTQRMRNYMQDKQVSLLYVGTGDQAQVRRLFNSTAQVPELSVAMLEQLHALKNRSAAPLSELWLTDHSEQRSHLYIFIRLDERALESGWLGLEMDTREVSKALSDQSAGEFMMLNADGIQVFSNNPQDSLSQILLSPQGENFFGFIGNGLLPDHLVIRKHLKSSDWQLVYSIDLVAVLVGLWKQLLGSLLFCLFSITLIVLLMRRFEQRLIAPAVHRIEALIESEAFNRDVIETAPVALCVLSRSDGKVVLENHLAHQWLGAGLERDVLCTGWIREAFDSIDAECSHYFETADGRHLYLSSAPTRYRGEDVLFCAFSDISERKQVEAALEDARQSADLANQAKTLFLATMSHEIRTPLYGVLGTLELLSRTRLDAQQKDYLHAIEGSSATLLQLICDVLDVSKIEAGQLVLEVSEFSPLELVHEVIQSYSAAAISKGLQLYTCLDPHLPERLIGDVSRIRQILNNLLSNALKFTDCGRVVLRVRLLHREGERSGLLWQVSDTGKGIAEEDQPYIFDPFYQVEGNSHVIAGTGLGLPICQRLTQLMNGQMRLVSEAGLGSSFTLTLPLEVAHGPDDKSVSHCLLAEVIFVVSPIRELAESVAGWLRRWGARVQLVLPIEMGVPHGQILVELHPGSIAPTLLPHWVGPRILVSSNGCSEPRHEDGIWYVNLNNLYAIRQAVSQAQGLWISTRDDHTYQQEMRRLDLRVLVAEDNIINQLILKDQLEELGCSVVLVSDGDEALQRWKLGQFDLILSDVNMPKMNGYALARELRRQGCVVPIIGATANAMRGEEELCMAAGMNHCLVKPFALQALFNCLAAYQGSSCEAL